MMPRLLATLVLALSVCALSSTSAPAQDTARAIGHGVVQVSAARTVTWPSRLGDVRVSVSIHEHAVTLRLERDGAPARTVTFDGIYWGEPLYADYGTWNDGTLGVRIFESPPSLGWPRFTACARIEVRDRSVGVIEVASPAEWDCNDVWSGRTP